MEKHLIQGLEQGICIITLDHIVVWENKVVL